MTKLWSPTWTVSRDFRISRAQVKGFAIGWQTGHFEQMGRTTIIRESVYGGYGFTVTFSSRFWAANNKMWRFEDVFDDVYAMPPSSTTPISCGAIEMNFNWQDLCQGFLLIMALPATTSTFYWQEYPAVTYPYWNKNGLRWKRTPPFINVT